jgi:hypothetical protein
LYRVVDKRRLKLDESGDETSHPFAEPDIFRDAPAALGFIYRDSCMDCKANLLESK